MHTVSPSCGKAATCLITGFHKLPSMFQFSSIKELAATKTVTEHACSVCQLRELQQHAEADHHSISRQSLPCCDCYDCQSSTLHVAMVAILAANSVCNWRFKLLHFQDLLHTVLTLLHLCLTHKMPITAGKPGGDMCPYWCRFKLCVMWLYGWVAIYCANAP